MKSHTMHDEFSARGSSGKVDKVENDTAEQESDYGRTFKLFVTGILVMVWICNVRISKFL